MKALALSVFAGLVIVAYLLPEREIEQRDGILVPQEPRQTNTESAAWEHNSYKFKPLASFTVRGRVLLIDRYRIGRESDISPLDLTLGWGAMSDNGFLSHYSLFRGHRSYSWQAKSQSPPLPFRDVVNHTANIHVIPADEGLAKQLKALHPGNIVELGGFLVEVTGRDGWIWRSSLSRDDSGPGACELMWVDWLRAG